MVQAVCFELRFGSYSDTKSCGCEPAVRNSTVKNEKPQAIISLCKHCCAGFSVRFCQQFSHLCLVSFFFLTSLTSSASIRERCTDCELKGDLNMSCPNEM